MVFGFFRRKKDKDKKSKELKVGELRKLLKEGKYKEIVDLLKDRYRENNELMQIYFEALVNLGRREEAKKLLQEVGKENLPPSAVLKLMEEPPKKESLFEKFKKGLKKTRELIGLNNFFASHKTLDEEFFEDLEELLIKLDVGIDTAVKLVEEIREKKNQFKDIEEVKEYLKRRFKEILSKCRSEFKLTKKPSVVLFVGVNGSGKTTTVGKLAYKLVKEGKKVLIVAADTFRAAATEQLKTWADRSGADFVGDREGADPGAVLYRGLQKAFGENYDVVLVDTAGRLHTKEHLLREMQKLVKVVKKFDPDQPEEVLLVLDATIGQNSINQAKLFASAIDVSGIVLTKLDGTAKGGAVISICKQLGIPVKFIGVGEGIDDLEPFDPDKFVDAMFE